MTKEEHIKNLKAIKKVGLCKKYLDSMNEAIKALEQQPSEDCVSRQAVIDLIYADWKYEGLELSVNELPPVTPKHKGGEWINSVYSVGFTCTCCLLTQTSGIKYDFCPSCGCRMTKED